MLPVPARVEYLAALNSPFSATAVSGDLPCCLFVGVPRLQSCCWLVPQGACHGQVQLAQILLLDYNQAQQLAETRGLPLMVVVLAKGDRPSGPLLDSDVVRRSCAFLNVAVLAGETVSRKLNSGPPGSVLFLDGGGKILRGSTRAAASNNCRRQWPALQRELAREPSRGLTTGPARWLRSRAMSSSRRASQTSSHCSRTRTRA